MWTLSSNTPVLGKGRQVNPLSSLNSQSSLLNDRSMTDPVSYLHPNPRKTQGGQHVTILGCQLDYICN